MRIQAPAATRSVLFLSAALLFLALPVAAQLGQRYDLPSSGGAKTFYYQKGNEAVRAEPLSLSADASKVDLKVFIAGGSMRQTKPLDEFTPDSQYRIVETLTPQDDPQAQLELAKYAASLGLTTSADRALKCARSLTDDPEYGTAVAGEVAESAVDAQIAEFRKLLAEGQIGKAERKLRAMVARYPEQIDARRGKELQDEVDTARTELKEGRAIAADNAADQKAQEDRERLLKPLRQDLSKGQEEKERGMADSKHTGQATTSFKSAISRFERVQKRGEELTHRHGNDQSLVTEVERLSNSARTQQIDTMLSMASMQMLRSQYNDAMGTVNQILAMDQGNTRALAMRGRIEVSANRGWGW